MVQLGCDVQSSSNNCSELLVVDAEGNEAMLKHNFITADVETGIVSLGRLYQQSWAVFPEDSGPMLCPHVLISVFLCVVVTVR